jgi:plastocyanin
MTLPTSPRSPSSRFTRLLALVAVAGVALALAACSSATPTSSAKSTSPSASASAAPSATKPDTIIIHNFAFHPDTLTVAPGATVTVTNEDKVAHTVTSTSGHYFNTGDVDPGTTVTFRAPTKPGSYPYFCQIHQYMTGTLVVK